MKPGASGSLKWNRNPGNDKTVNALEILPVAVCFFKNGRIQDLPIYSFYHQDVCILGKLKGTDIRGRLLIIHHVIMKIK